MSEKVSIKLPAHLAQYVKPDAPEEGKLQVISGGVAATAAERVTLLFFLCYDKNQEIKSAALTAMKRLPPSLAADISASPDSHPRLKELLVKLYPHPCSPAPVLTPEPELSPAEPEDLSAAAETPAAVEASAETAADAETEEADEDAEEPAEEELPAEEEEEYRSKYQLAQAMGVGDKIKMALTGDKEWRSILIKDSNKLVNGAVVKNPRITEPEILTISKSVIQNDEIIRVICQNKEWIKNYEIRKALVLNHKTPLPVALRFMGFLTEKDLAGMAKSKNIASVLCNQARRMLTNKKKT